MVLAKCSDLLIHNGDCRQNCNQPLLLGSPGKKIPQQEGTEGDTVSHIVAWLGALRGDKQGTVALLEHLTDPKSYAAYDLAICLVSEAEYLRPNPSSRSAWRGDSDKQKLSLI